MFVNGVFQCEERGDTTRDSSEMCRTVLRFFFDNVPKTMFKINANIYIPKYEKPHIDGIPRRRLTNCVDKVKIIDRDPEYVNIQSR